MSDISRVSGIDLHTHTNASDGSDSPEQLVAKAAELGLSTIGVTDHDTLAGLPEALSAAANRGIEVIPGIELSVEDRGRRFHMLSYFIPPDYAPLNNRLRVVREWRATRNDRMLKRAQDLGIDLTWDDLRREAGEDAQVVGRPHFAAALMRKGLVGSVAQAFDRYLATGKPLYEAKQGLGAGEAAELVHGAGAITVLAHPGLSPWPEPEVLEPQLRALVDAGTVDGLECYYSQHSEEQTQAYLAIANRLGLMVSGGSDYHGIPKPHVSLGVVYQGQPLPSTLLPPLRQAAEQHSKQSVSP